MSNVTQTLINSFLEERNKVQVVARAPHAHAVKTLYLQLDDIQCPVFSLTQEERNKLQLTIEEDRDGLTLSTPEWISFTTFTSKGFELTGRFDKHDSWLVE